MEKITKYFKTNYENDTTIEYVSTGLYSMLNCSYTSEDPDYGTDTIHYVSKTVVPCEQLAYEMLQGVTKYLDVYDGEYEEDIADLEREYGNYGMSTMIAVEKALTEISKDYNPKRWYMTVREASSLMAKRLLEDGNVTFAFCESDREEAKGNPFDHVDEGGWHGVKRIRGFFDNEPCEFIVAVGHYGGGNVGFGYTDYDAPNETNMYECAKAVRKAICEATGWDSDNMIYLEEDEKKEDK